VLSRLGKGSLPSSLQVPEVLVLGSDGDIGPADAIDQLSRADRKPIHIEFGPSALLEVLAAPNGVRTFISSEYETGGSNFAALHQLTPIDSFRFGNLYVTEVSGRA